MENKLENFPLAIIQKMLYYQEFYGNQKSEIAFQNNPSANKKQGGFDWKFTKEGYGFWREVIALENFDLFFKNFYPKVMWVSDNNGPEYKRVVFMKKNDKYLAWGTAENLDDSENYTAVVGWEYAREYYPIKIYSSSEIVNVRRYLKKKKTWYQLAVISQVDTTSKAVCGRVIGTTYIKYQLTKNNPLSETAWSQEEVELLTPELKESLIAMEYSII